MELTTIEDLHNRNTDGSFPVLIDVRHDRILWSKKNLETGMYENGHFRLINDYRGVVYKGCYYFPAAFDYTPPSDDGKIAANASISVSAVDKSVVEIIEAMEGKAEAVITTAFEKISNDDVVFTPIRTTKFEMSLVDWTKLTAKWKLTQDPVLSLNIPRALGTLQRCPSAS